MDLCKTVRGVLWAGMLLIGAMAGNDVLAAEAAPFVDARSGDPEGRPVVLIPGLASSGEVWAETAAALARYDVHTLTLAGFAGVPPRDDDAAVVAGAAEAIAAMLERENLQNVALVGHSLGAQVALHAAALAPERVSQIVAVDSAPFYAGLVQPGATPEQAKAFADATRAQLLAMPEEVFRAQQAAGMAIYSKDPAYVATLIAWSNASDRATVAAAFAEVAGGDFRGVLEQVEAPVLALAAYDPAMGVPRERIESVFREQYAAAPGAHVTLIDDSYHFIMHDQEAAFLGALVAFLEGEGE